MCNHRVIYEGKEYKFGNIVKMGLADIKRWECIKCGSKFYGSDRGWITKK